jgi:phosphate starvation-inducible PhoH-like protein
MRGKNKKYRSMRGILDDEDYSDYYEEETLIGMMSPLSRSAPTKQHGMEWKHVKPLKARNDKQAELLNLLERPDVHIVVVTGCAGTGKTFVSVSHAMEQFQSGAIHKIILTRPTINVNNAQIGFLPGSALDKLTPYLLPIIDVMHNYTSPAQVQKLLEANTIEVSPLLFMRGRSFNNCLVICDEAQNTTVNEMLMLLTRLGQGSKMIINGDELQTDTRGGVNGLTDLLQKLEKNPQEGIAVVRFTEAEVTRHPMVRKILRLYNTNTVPTV